jgi:serine/threonine-protein kinase HipA
MKRTLQVFLGNNSRRVGTLHYEQERGREYSAFTYDAAWLAARDGFAIEPDLPLMPAPRHHKRVQNGSVFHAAIADTEPDGWAQRVIQRDHAKRRRNAQRKGAKTDFAPLNAVDYLLAVDDISRVGALRFQDETGVFQRAGAPGLRTAPPLLELRQLADASRAIEMNSETASDLAYLRGRGTSLGGLRPKCTVVDDDGMLAIGKFPSVQDARAITKGEVLAMQLAKKAGINAADARLVDSDGIPVALIRRFDRTADGRRLAYVSAATLLGVESTDAQVHYYTEIADAIRLHGAAAQADIEELWRRIAFSIFITNVDDHLHNHGFLHVEGGLWRLAPAFDINPFPERLRELKTWISPDTGPDATIEALMSVIAYFRMPKPKAKKILREVNAVVSTWRNSGRALGMTAGELDKFATAFEHQERVAAALAIK